MHFGLERIVTHPQKVSLNVTGDDAGMLRPWWNMKMSLIKTKTKLKHVHIAYAEPTIYVYTAFIYIFRSSV